MGFNRTFFHSIVALAAVCRIANAIAIETVAIGNPGNAAASGGYGVVAYPYRMGKYEVTIAEYAEFLNSVDPKGSNLRGLYSPAMRHIGSSYGIDLVSENLDGAKYDVFFEAGDKPVTNVSWYDTLRFANWLHNGQDDGDTETGAYTLVSDCFPTLGCTIVRNPDAKWFLPTDEEWFKAAYHKNDGITGNYWGYPTATDVEPFSDQPPGNDSPSPSNVANFRKDDGVSNSFNDGFAVSGSNVFEGFFTFDYRTDVGIFASASSPYGTFDQGGNVEEWIETHDNLLARHTRGGAWIHSSNFLHRSRLSGFYDRTAENYQTGFRVATIVPEPGMLQLGVIAFVILLSRRIAGSKRCRHKSDNR